MSIDVAATRKFAFALLTGLLFAASAATGAWAQGAAVEGRPSVALEVEPERAHRSGTILLVEDDDQVRTIARSILAVRISRSSPMARPWLALIRRSPSRKFCGAGT